MDDGFFQLKSAADLFEKLQWEHQNLVAHPGNAWHAFNFFVTAEHMADWNNCLSMKKTEPLLALCSHLANGGKHLKAEDKKHKLVVSTNHDGVYEPGVFEEGVFEESLQITLEPEAAKALGTATIDAVSLASRVLEFWRERRR
jgi:hypothetical protein